MGPGACLPELLTHTGPHALRATQVFNCRQSGSWPAQDKWPPMLLCRTTQSKMQLLLTRVKPHSPDQAPGGPPAGFKGRPELRLLLLFHRTGWRKGKKERRSIQWVIPEDGHFTCLPTLSSNPLEPVPQQEAGKAGGGTQDRSCQPPEV